MKLLKTVALSTIIASNICAINPKTMNVFKENWQANTVWFASNQKLFEKTSIYELADFVQSYENLKAATDELLITTMPVTWQKALIETDKYLTALAPLYIAIKEELQSTETSKNNEFPRVEWVITYKNLINLNAIKNHISAVNSYLTK